MTDHGPRIPTSHELVIALALVAAVTWWVLWAVIGLDPTTSDPSPVPTTWHSGPGDNVVITP